MPNSVAEHVNMQRKEKIRLAGERLLWEDALEIVEDQECERKHDRCKGVYMSNRTKNKNQMTRFKSYWNSLLANPVDVMEKFLDEYYGDGKKVVELGDAHDANDNWKNGGWSDSVCKCERSE